MSRIQSLLDIIVKVTDEGLGNLNKAQVAIKALTDSEVQHQKTRGKTAGQLRTLRVLDEAFISTIANEARKTVETNKVSSRRLQIQNEAIRKERERRVVLAQLAMQQGRLSDAERQLGIAMRHTKRHSTESIRIQRMLSRVQRDRARQASKAAAEEMKQAFSEASVARAAGHTAREIAILNRLLKHNKIDTKSAQRAHEQLARAQRRQSMEIDREIKRFRRLRSAINSVRLATHGVTKAFGIFTRILAAGVLIGFTIRTIGRAISRFIFSPLAAVTKEVLTVTDKFRNINASMIGIVGSMRAVRSLTKDIKAATEGLPVPALEAISGVGGLAFTAGTSSIISTEAGREDKLAKILRVLTGLATIDPEQGVSGARFAVREALSGEVRSLRFRFELSPQVIAATIGKSLAEVKADPKLMLEALSKFVDTFIGDQAIEQFSKLMSVQGKRLHGALQEFFNLIGDQGLYDRVTTSLKNIADSILRSVRSSDGAPGAGKAAVLIDNSLRRLLNTVVRSLALAIERLTGVAIDVSDNFKNLNIDKLSLAFAKIIDRLSEFAAAMIVLVPSIVNAIESLTSFAVGPVTRESIQERLEELYAERKRLRITGRGYTQSIHDQTGFDSNLGYIQALTIKTNKEIVRLRKRLELLNNIDDIFKKEEEPGGIFAELGAQLNKIDQIAEQSVKNLPKQAIKKDLGDRTTVLLKAVQQMYDPDVPGSLGAILKSAAETEKKYTKDAATAADYAKELEALREQTSSAAKAVRTTFTDSLYGVLQGSEGFTRQLPDLFRIRQGQDLLSFFGASKPGPVSDVLGGERATKYGANVTSQFAAQLEEITSRIGISQADRLDPSLIDDVIRLIDNVGDSITRTSDNAKLGASVMEDYSDSIIEILQGKLKGEKDVGIREQLNIAIVKMIEFRDKAKEVFSDFDLHLKKAAEAISSTFGDSITNGMIAAFEGGADGVLSVLDDMAKSIQRIILRLIIEFTVLRGFINPFLNNAFGLTGTNMLPTLGASGMMLGGGRVRGYQAGGFIASSPMTFPMQGGGTGLLGEEAPEAVLPLEQDSSGRLGVVGIGGGGTRIIKVNMTVKTPDADSFRRSGRQIRRHLKEIASI